MHRKINKKTLKKECWRAGLSITVLARRIRRSRPQLYRALSNPRQHKPTVKLIQEALGA